jgi:hypothetical protein
MPHLLSTYYNIINLDQFTIKIMYITSIQNFIVNIDRNKLLIVRYDRTCKYNLEYVL